MHGVTVCARLSQRVAVVESVDERHARKVLARIAMEQLDETARDKLRVLDNTPLQDEALFLDDSPLAGAVRTVPLVRRLERITDTFPYWEPAARVAGAVDETGSSEPSQSVSAPKEDAPPPAEASGDEEDEADRDRPGGKGRRRGRRPKKGKARGQAKSAAAA